MDKSSKKLLIAIGILVCCFILFFFIRLIYNPDEGAMTIDSLHKANIEGKESDTNYMYNGFSFVYFDNLWWTQVQKNGTLFDVPLHFGPKDLEGIPLTGKITGQFKQPSVYISFNPSEEDLKFVALSSAELSLSLVKGIGVFPIAACDRNETRACKDRPIVTCEDEDKAVIYLKQTNSTGAVRLKSNCVELEGNGAELVKATDRFLLQLYGVMG